MTQEVKKWAEVIQKAGLAQVGTDGVR
jgi:hypothetical protein